MKGTQLGYFLNSDMSITQQSGDITIGIVVCSYENGGGQAMTLKPLGNYKWGGYGIDIPTPGSGSNETASIETSSCQNTDEIITAGDSNIYPAAWAAYNYTTMGTKVGDWCLPAAGIFTSIQNNISLINKKLSAAGGSQFKSDTKVWSSSEYHDRGYSAWFGNFSLSSFYGLTAISKEVSYEVRPVIEF